MVTDRGDEFGEEREGRGRTARKQAAEATTDLAMRMVEASAGLFRDLPENLLEELALARRLTARGARKRQIKRVAGLLRRDEDAAAAARVALDGVDRSSLAERERFHHVEELRDGLSDPECFAETLEKVAEELPALDRQELSRLALRVHSTGDKTTSRKIFRCLRDAYEALPGLQETVDQG